MKTGPTTDPILLAHKRLGESQSQTEPSSEEVRAMLAVTRPSKAIALPGRWSEYRARVWALVGSDELEAKRRAHEWLEKYFEGRALALRLASNPEILSEAVDRERIALALRRYDDPGAPLFTAQEVLSIFTHDEREALLAAVEDFLRESNPLSRAESEEEVLALLKTHAGGDLASSAFLTFCDDATARRIATVLVERWARQQSESSSKS